MTLKSIPNFLEYICCPECRGDLNAFGSSSANGFFCPACRLAFPTFDGVLILLDLGSRNAKLETPLLRELATHADGEQSLEACERTLNLLAAAPNDAYAWEDEKHWADEYSAYLKSGKNKNWNDRLWQRSPLFQVATKYLEGTKARSRVIVDVGCGEGQDLRHFLVPYLREEDVYIGLDISLPGLLLNRKRNPHTRSVFILGSADKPPLRPRIANVAICLGTLHHMRAKEKGLSTIAELVFEGVMLLSDPINGHFLPERFRFSRASRSAHDDSIDYAEFRRSADSLNLRLDYERQFSGFVYYLLMKSLRPLLLKSQRLHNSAHMLDEILIKTLGGVIPILRPRALITALSKKVEVHQTGGTVLSNYAIGGA